MTQLEITDSLFWSKMQAVSYPLLIKRALSPNRRDPLLPGLLASGPFLNEELLAMLEPYFEY